ncbi:MAG: hypothetical protein KDA89_14005 [Planctomycetaceae bacterium]|nr:hypothetical protein [Planctomycetaceae bacterium]
MDEGIFERDRRIRSAGLTMGQTFYLTTLNQLVGNNAEAWPSQAAIAKAMNACTRAVRKWQSELEAMGVIQIDSGCGRTLTNRYRIHLDALPQKEESRTAITARNEEPCSAITEENEESHAAVMRNDVPLNTEPRAYGKINKDQKKNQSECAHSRRFVKPTAEQVRTYATSQGSSHFEADRFIDHFESNGWRIGRTAMKDWQAAVRNWIRSGGTGHRSPAESADDDWPHVRQIVCRKYHPDLKNTADVRSSLTPEQFAAAVTVGLARIANADSFDRGTPEAYRAARRARA